MATMQCPACGLIVPYFCCEGLVCPACGYDEEQNVLPGDEVAGGNTPQGSARKLVPADSGTPQPPVQ
jgi:hypothetical protein